MAKQLNAQSRLAQTNVGTPIYMSPELINEQVGREPFMLTSMLAYMLHVLCLQFRGSAKLNCSPRLISDTILHWIPMILLN